MSGSILEFLPDAVMRAGLRGGAEAKQNKQQMEVGAA